MPIEIPTIETSLTPNKVEMVVEMVGITKAFPGIIANSNVSLSIKPAAFHAIIGENGAGKSTLLNVLYGRYGPDSGTIRINDKVVNDLLHGPADAIRLGIGLVSQHYALIPALTVLENIMLGSEPTSGPGILMRRAAERKAVALAERLGLTGVNLNDRADRLSVAAQQKVEIMKALYRDAKVLLLDEPTATLAPQEADSLFGLLHTLQSAGTTIVFVTHKLREVMAHSTAVTVLRGGKNAGDFVTSQTYPEELLERMVGTRQSSSDQTRSQNALDMVGAPGSRKAQPLLTIDRVSIRARSGALAVKDASASVLPGEILGIAGVDGSGQKELSEAIVGITPLLDGHIWLAEGDFMSRTDITGYSVRQRQRLGIAYIPEDRHRSAVVMDFSIAENYLLGHEMDSSWGGGAILQPTIIGSRADAMISAYDVRLGQRTSSARAVDLSGGNQQKIVIARSLDSNPRLLVACQPTRGLDTGATRFVYDSLIRARDKGLGVVLFSLDLDEVIELSDRIAVMFNGRIVGILAREEATPERVGAMMTGSDPGDQIT